MNKLKIFLFLTFILFFSTIVIAEPNVNNFTPEKTNNFPKEIQLSDKIEPQPFSNISKEKWTRDQKIAVASIIIGVAISLGSIFISIILSIFIPEIRGWLGLKNL